MFYPPGKNSEKPYGGGGGGGEPPLDQMVVSVSYCYLLLKIYVFYIVEKKLNFLYISQCFIKNILKYILYLKTEILYYNYL